MITSFMKLILLLIFISAAICRLPLYSVHWLLVTVLRMLSSGAGVTSWPLVILSPHGTLLGTQGKQTDTPFITD